MENRLGVVKFGAQQFGAGVVSACRGGQDGARDLSNELMNVEDAAGGVRDSAQNAANAARDMGKDVNDAGDKVEAIGDKLRKAAEGARP